MKTMKKTRYYAICNVGGPISVRLAGASEEEALASYAVLDGRGAIDGAKTHAEDDLGIEDAADLDEDTFESALETAGATRVRGLEMVNNAHAGTAANLADGWTLWSVGQD